MTIDESKTVLTTHREHWERLLSEGICDASEGRETIDAFTMAIASLEAWERVKQEIEDMLETLSDGGDDWFTAEKLNDVLEIIDKHMQEVEK